MNNVRRFQAPTSREALAKARLAFGDATLILSNRATAEGVEVVATSEDSLQEAGVGLPVASRPSAPVSRSATPASTRAAAAPRDRADHSQSSVADDTQAMAMSTLNFQDYVRERMLRRRKEALAHDQAPATLARVAHDPAAQAALIQASRAPAATALSTRGSFADRAAASAPTTLEPGVAQALGLPAPQTPQFPRLSDADLTGAAIDGKARRTLPSAPRTLKSSAPQAAMSANDTQRLMGEMAQMKALIEERFTTLTWLGQARQDPIRANLMIKLIRAGYSPRLARSVLEHLPGELSVAEAFQWTLQVLQRNLRTDTPDTALLETGGVVALVGPTGVGKTTTAAKLAGLCAQEYGAHSVGLITLDTFRVGAHEQLRQYGRMLGVVAHQAHDHAALQDLLGLLSSKKLVLVDTTGFAPRDPRGREMLHHLDDERIERVLVVPAGMHGDTLDEAVSVFKDLGANQLILSKSDEAAKLAPALDVLIRHQMVLRGVTTGQRVPEDWEAADAGQLVRAALRTPAQSAFDPKDDEVGLYFAQSDQARPVSLAI
jgi:flagellar biosynthesis protein FlhF